jgi:hypothetical protein
VKLSSTLVEGNPPVGVLVAVLVGSGVLVLVLVLVPVAVVVGSGVLVLVGVAVGAPVLRVKEMSSRRGEVLPGPVKASWYWR